MHDGQCVHDVHVSQHYGCMHCALSYQPCYEGWMLAHHCVQRLLLGLAVLACHIVHMVGHMQWVACLLYAYDAQGHIHAVRYCHVVRHVHAVCVTCIHHSVTGWSVPHSLGRVAGWALYFLPPLGLGPGLSPLPFILPSFLVPGFGLPPIDRCTPSTLHQGGCIALAPPNYTAPPCISGGSESHGAGRYNAYHCRITRPVPRGRTAARCKHTAIPGSRTHTVASRYSARDTRCAGRGAERIT